ncbi:hypothetical protein [Streptomyces parvulus]|uniref:hypothetical protein n=1 Tax=Streptomyces parvulus TaxID=146923 RepID=UPI001CF988A6|nr:hypothetical protein [Streptomyces parvulus]
MTSQPPANPPLLTADQIKHLEMIQAIIARLANGSFLIKGWTMTVAGVLFGVSASNLTWRVTLAGAIPLIGFWLLDSYYLRQERLFRKLYDAVRKPGSSVEPFSMNISVFHAEVPWGKVIRSHTMVNFYGLLFVVDVAFTATAIVESLKGS